MSSDDVWAALAEVMDPEIPVLSVVDLGVVAEVRVQGEDVAVDLMPTFAACPATALIRRQVEERLRRLEGVGRVEVRLVSDPAWTSDRLTERGKELLASFGIAFPAAGVVRCPYCASERTERQSSFGPTLCRQVYYCTSCRQPFEAWKEVRLVDRVP
jgi:ring-1,2-phenylacetyl-CoA epoxidase subunit PaaD